MASQMFVNLPVRDLKRSVDFFTALGFSFNPQFTDDNATCMIVSDHNFVMLLVESFFQSFTPKPISDARRQTEMLVAISCDSRGAVDEIIAKNPDKVADAKTNPKAIGWFVGQVMKASGGKASPQAVNDLLKAKLGL